MRTLFRWVIVFLAIAGAVALATASFDVSFGREDYWDHRGIFFLIFITLFPRLTMLFSSVVSGGVIGWLAWIFAPRILVAVLATLAYWHQNPALVVISWLVALSGESSEKYVVVRRRHVRLNPKRGYESAKWVKPESKE